MIIVVQCKEYNLHPSSMIYQLIQLHAMGITDDAACLQALEATGGDLEAALEILYSK